MHLAQASPISENIPVLGVEYVSSEFDPAGALRRNALLLEGDAAHVLRAMPAASVDCVMTSPPYWGHREYDGGGIGLEDSADQFISALAKICFELKRVLAPGGSFWLNLGDTYDKKRLSMIPHRVAIHLVDHQGWIMRNDVVWNKVKGGMDNSPDRLGNTHEHVFHFVKTARGYFYDADAIRNDPRKSKVKNGVIISATGVSGVRYRRQIELSTSLTEDEKLLANAALDQMLASVGAGEYSDFRMVIRGQQRSTHSDSKRLSGRAKELESKGFYFLRYHPKGSKPSDVWDVLPEDTQNRKLHFAPFPEDLCKIPIAATCPQDGVFLDPFCGTGSALAVARQMGRRAIGIDTSSSYLNLASERLRSL